MRSIILSTRSLAIAVACMLAAACAKESNTLAVETPTEYRDRHPIVIASAEEGLDIFVRGQAIDRRQALEIKAAAADYQATGRGKMTMLVPVGARGEANRGAVAVRAALADAGVRDVSQAPYRVEGPAIEQPIRIIYPKLKARVATKCNQWPEDLGGFDQFPSLNSKPYYNFGCATQTMLANQVADPLDLIRGQTETRVDTARRIAVIEAQREGRDPSMRYRATGTTINAAVGTN